MRSRLPENPDPDGSLARIEPAPEVLDDFDRFSDHLRSFEVRDAEQRVAEIVHAIDILSHSPLIGRPAKGGNRELVIGRAGRGDLALYRFVPEIDTVFVLAVCSQRETGYVRR